MAPRLFIFLLILMLFPEENAWRRRRRRRWNPPPPQDCTVSALFCLSLENRRTRNTKEWSAWASCSQNCDIGTQSRTRTIVTGASWGGSCSYHFSEHQSCGLVNGGCDKICNNGQCSCPVPGYTQSGNKCYDINECAPNGGKGPCSHICKNTVGSYYCECPAGYYMSTSDSHQCLAYDCGDPAALFNACPSDSYSDHISSVCAKVTASCLQGTTYNEQCSLTCTQNYALAKIAAQPNKKFGEEYSSVDFSSVISTLTCQKTKSWQRSNIWDVLDNELGNYYCRRTNDPPVNLHLNGSDLLESRPL
ncbi:hypothetical protein OS493_018418 [Desmophyllum pertusum]|uniref:EGF-like domain-containing protein n=1 Tax=Desmophyllum pertusum TaxID=174260 RepID=A0A9X0A1N0_9CNID|nr:hypothetical protein OS493_018418 [Desmophyllum pertusum]